MSQTADAAGFNHMMQAVQQQIAQPMHPIQTTHPATASRVSPEGHGPAVVNAPGQPPVPDPTFAPPAPPAPQALEIGGVQVNPDRRAQLENRYLGHAAPAPMVSAVPAAPPSDPNALASLRADLDARQAALGGNGNGLTASQATTQQPPARQPLFADDFVAGVNEEVPRLGDGLQRIGDLMSQVIERQDSLDTALQTQRAREDHERREARHFDELNGVLDAFQGEPFANKGEMAVFMRDRGLGRDPTRFREHAQTAYDALYGGKITVALGAPLQEQTVHQVPMPGIVPSLGTGPTSPANAAATSEQIAGMPWGQVTHAAMRAQGYDPSLL